MEPKSHNDLPADAGAESVRKPYAKPSLQELGKLHLTTGGASPTGRPDGASGMAMA
jgi:hypothetical protein